MLTPLAFSKQVVKHGTVGVVSDPHEIANVLGKEGVEFMIENARLTPLKITFGAPSCVPATAFESSGASLSAEDIRELFAQEEVSYLAEMMNYPGVIFDDPDIIEKLNVSKEFGYPIDGHAPGLKGEDLKKYVGAGISTDHECFTTEEAVEKIKLGMSVLIREGSGAKNFNTLIPLIREYPDKIMFCSDDLHPDNLMEGHINLLVKRALEMNYDLFDVLRSASLNAVKHYSLDIGLLQINDPADFIIVENLVDFPVLSTYINGNKVSENGQTTIKDHSFSFPNNFNIDKIQQSDISVFAVSDKMRVIEALDGELITNSIICDVHQEGGDAISNPAVDTLKLVVLNRYSNEKPAVAFIKGFNLKKGAIATSIAHDSHNIICVGVSDKDIVDTINWIIKEKGGLAVNDGDIIEGLALEVAGIVSGKSIEYVSSSYTNLSHKAELMGSELKAPFMTLAFMALLVIPELKLSDKGLFDGKSFEFTNLFV